VSGGPAPHPRAVLAAVACGGALGATARHALTRALPAAPDGFPWGVWLVNVTGCALIGVLMALAAAGGWAARPLARPFLGVGVLGGFTTFSAYAGDTVRLLEEGRPALAAACAGGTAAAALAAVALAASLTRVGASGRHGGAPGGRP
jgi:CrcB protein